MSKGQGRDEYFRRFVPENVAEGNIAFDNEILRCTVGSELHGTGLPNTEDHDEMGVYIEPPECVLGFKRMDHFTWRSKPEGVRSEHGDTDLVLYSLRKYMSMAMQGNPSVLLILFCPQDFLMYKTSVGENLREIHPLIVSKYAVPRFLGYLESQKQRLMGIAKGHTPNRPEIVAEFGYDTKYAMHALRLALQGIELVTTGAMTLPVPNPDGDLLRAVRRGDYNYRQVLELLDYYENQLKIEAEASDLRPEPDKAAIEKWLIQIHLNHWKR